MGSSIIFDLVDSEKVVWGLMKIFNIISEVSKTVLSILIPVSVIYLMFVAPQDNLVIGVTLSILFFISLWFVLNYTLPEWIICLMVSLFFVDIGSSIIKNICQSIPNIHFPIRSKRRRFIRR